MLFFTKEKMMLLILVLGLGGTQYMIQGMSFLSKQKAKKIFSKTMTGVHWFLLLGGPVTMAYDTDALYPYFGTVAGAEADGLVVDCSELENLVNEKREKKIRVKCSISNSNTEWMSANALMMSTPHFIVAAFTRADVREMLKKSEAANELKGMLDHEAHHIDSGDVWRFILVNMASIGACHYIWKATKCIKPFKGIWSTAPFLLKESCKIPSALIKTGFATIPLMAYHRTREFAADRSIKDIESLKGLKSFLEFSARQDEKQRPVDRIMSKIFGSHPSSTERCVRVEKRIKELEALDQP